MMKTLHTNPVSIIGASVLLAFFFSLPAAGLAQQNQAGVEPKKLAVDVVSVRKLGRLYGIVQEQTAESVSIVVRREWLQKTYPKFWTEHIESEKNSMQEDREEIKQRIESWRQEYEGDDRLAMDEFLDENIELLALDDPIDVSDLDFTIVKVDRESVRKVFTQTPEKHRLAAVAWSEKLDRVETTNATVVQRKLQKEKVDIDGYQLKLGNEIPVSIESAEKWEARKALIEFGILSRVEYQGNGSIFLRRGADADPAAAIKAMMEGGGLGGLGGLSQLDQLGKDLGLPEFQDRNRGRDRDPNAWMKPMIRAAEKENRRCFSVAKMTQGRSVKVEMRLYFKSGDQGWHPLASFTGSAVVADQTVDDVDVLKQDPRISQVMDLAKQLGIADPKVIEQALQNGAATKRALSKATSDLDDFVAQYSHEIDNPPLERQR